MSDTKPSIAREPSRFTITTTENTLAEGDSIDISGLPKDIQDALKPFDANGDGEVDLQELAAGGMLYQNLKNSYATCKKFLGYAVILIVVLCACLGGVSFWAANAAKDTTVGADGRVMMSKETSDPVAVGQVEVSAPVAALAYLPVRVPPHVMHVSFKSEDGTTTHHRRVVAVDVVPRESVVLETVKGDVLSWSAGSKDLEVSTAGGAKWTKSVMCNECSAANVFADEEVTQALAEFYQDVGQDNESRKLMGFGIGWLLECLNDPTVPECEWMHVQCS